MKLFDRLSVARCSMFAILASGILVSPVIAQNAPVTQPTITTPPVEPVVEIKVERHRGIIGEGYAEKMTYTATCPKFVFDISASAIQESTNRAWVEAEIKKIPDIKTKWEDYELCLKTNFDLDRDIIKNNITNSLNDYIKADKVYGDDVYNAVDAAWQVVLKNEKAKKQITEELYVSKWAAPNGVYKGYFKGTKPEDVRYYSNCPAYAPEITADMIATVQTRARLMSLIDTIKTETNRRQVHAECRQKQAIEDFMTLQKALIDSFTVVTWTPEYESYRKKTDILEHVVSNLREPGGILASKPVVAPKPAVPPKPVTPKAKPKAKTKK